jgi:hypothetical protein
MVEYYALMYENGKMRPAETVPGMGWGGEGKRENDGASKKNEGQEVKIGLFWRWETWEGGWAQERRE